MNTITTSPRKAWGVMLGSSPESTFGMLASQGRLLIS